MIATESTAVAASAAPNLLSAHGLASDGREFHDHGLPHRRDDSPYPGPWRLPHHGLRAGLRNCLFRAHSRRRRPAERKAQWRNHRIVTTAPAPALFTLR